MIRPVSIRELSSRAVSKQTRWMEGALESVEETLGYLGAFAILCLLTIGARGLLATIAIVVFITSLGLASLLALFRKRIKARRLQRIEERHLALQRWQWVMETADRMAPALRHRLPGAGHVADEPPSAIASHDRLGRAGFGFVCYSSPAAADRALLRHLLANDRAQRKRIEEAQAQRLEAWHQSRRRRASLYYRLPPKEDV